jgi:hypothetical protein
VASQITYSHLGPVSKRNFSTASESRSMTRIRPSRSATMTMIADGSSRWSSLEQFADEIRRLGLTAALLTNGTDTIPAEVAAPGLESHFDAIFNSADIAFVKPDIRAFDHVLDALAVLGPDVFFTDDSAAKLLGASVPRCLGASSHGGMSGAVPPMERRRYRSLGAEIQGPTSGCDGPIRFCTWTGLREPFRITWTGGLSNGAATQSSRPPAG